MAAGLPSGLMEMPVEVLVSCDDSLYSSLKKQQSNFDKELMEYVKKHSQTKLSFTSNFRKYNYSNVAFVLVTSYSSLEHPELPYLGNTVIFDFLKWYFQTIKFSEIKIKFNGVKLKDIKACVIVQETKHELTVTFEDEFYPTTLKNFHEPFSVALSIDFDDIPHRGSGVHHGDSKEVEVKDIEFVEHRKELGVKKVVVLYDYSGPMDIVMKQRIIYIVDMRVEKELFQ